MAETAAKDLSNPLMKELGAKIEAEQKRLGFSDAKLCEFATETLKPRDPYRKLTITSAAFLMRLRPTVLETLLAALTREPARH
jgi:hypothetical protein